jgi:hypothetical protein
VDDYVLNNGDWVDLVEQKVVASWVHALPSIQCKCNQDEVKHGHLQEKKKIKKLKLIVLDIFCVKWMCWFVRFNSRALGGGHKHFIMKIKYNEPRYIQICSLLVWCASCCHVP